MSPRGSTTEPPASIGTMLREHLREQGLPDDSGVSQRWVRVRFLGLPLVFPNFDARRAILVCHDVHHLLTGYDTSWRGEAEIGAFEIATGCGHHWAAWLFNLGGFSFGLCIAPRWTWRAFVRGRRCTNCYGRPIDEVLRTDVGEARRALGLERTVPAGSIGDALAFTGWVASVAALPVGALALLVAWWAANG